MGRHRAAKEFKLLSWKRGFKDHNIYNEKERPYSEERKKKKNKIEVKK